MADEDHDRAPQGAGQGAADRAGRRHRPDSTALNVVVVVLALGAIAAGGGVTYQYYAEHRAQEKWRAARSAGGGGGMFGRPHFALKEKDGKKLLWGRGEAESEDSEWFDVTDATIPPEEFNHGIGKDTIAAIDDPVFVDPGDKRLERHDVGEKTPVIGYVHNGEAKAYPIPLMGSHELANDTIGGKPVTVGY